MNVFENFFVFWFDSLCYVFSEFLIFGGVMCYDEYLGVIIL